MFAVDQWNELWLSVASLTAVAVFTYSLTALLPRAIGNAMDKRLNPVENRLSSIEVQLKANNGSTLRDAVNRIERDAAVVNVRLEERLKSIEDREALFRARSDERFKLLEDRAFGPRFAP